MKLIIKETPENIQKLDNNQIFVFGSNIYGRHGKGAAKLARTKFGAINGEGEGLFGQSYAIPTKDAALQPLPLKMIKSSIDVFLNKVMNDHKNHYLVTEIGCGLAGFSPKQIAPFFQPVFDHNIKNISLPQRFIQVLLG